MALCLHLCAIGYIKNTIWRFTNITNIDNFILSLSSGLNCRPKQEKKEENNNILVTNFKKEIINKKNQYAVIKQTWLENIAQQTPSPTNIRAFFSEPSLFDIKVLFFGPPDIKVFSTRPPNIEALFSRPPDVKVYLSFTLRYPLLFSPIMPMPGLGYICYREICKMLAFKTANLPLLLPYSKFKYLLVDEPWSFFFIRPI